MQQLTKQCQKCLYDKNKNVYPDDATEKDIQLYQQRIKNIIDTHLDSNGPEIVYDIRKVQLEMFGIARDFTDIKRFYNDYMMSLADGIRDDINASEDPLYRAMQYAMIGNYIDFGASNKVEVNKLDELLQSADDYAINKDVYHLLRNDLSQAHTFVFLTDNCGEIVLDQLLIEQIIKSYPQLDVTVIVKGFPTINDATMDDARQIGLDQMIRVIGNGSGIAGNSLRCISQEAHDLITQSDVVFSKGQGNYETLQHEALNIYFMFLCKCQLFTSRFHMDQYGGILTKNHK